MSMPGRGFCKKFYHLFKNLFFVKVELSFESEENISFYSDCSNIDVVL